MTTTVAAFSDTIRRIFEEEFTASIGNEARIPTYNGDDNYGEIRVTRQSMLAHQRRNRRHARWCESLVRTDVARDTYIFDVTKCNCAAGDRR
jgi:hypothetical protein